MTKFVLGWMENFLEPVGIILIIVKYDSKMKVLQRIVEDMLDVFQNFLKLVLIPVSMTVNRKIRSRNNGVPSCLLGL